MIFKTVFLHHAMSTTNAIRVQRLEPSVERIRPSRVHSSMRPLLIVLVLFTTLRASAQCCCADQIVDVRSPEPMHGNGIWHYRAQLDYGRKLHWSMDSIRGYPQGLRLRMPTQCGIDKVTWTLTDIRTGESMVINLYHLPGDAQLPNIRLPFSPGYVLHFDMNDILRSAATCGDVGGKYHIVDRICNASRVHHIFDEGQYIAFEPLDLQRWWKRPRAAESYTAPQEALYLDGPGGMQSYLLREVGKARIATLPRTITFTGYAMVEDNGTVNEIMLDRTPYEEIDMAIRNALLLSDRWQPAVVERPGALENTVAYTAIRRTVPISFVADPVSVWGTLGDFELDVRPAAPTSQDSLHLTFSWYAGSCGIYRDSVVITPPKATQPWTEIAVGIGIIGEDCTDIAINHRTIVLPPQPAGTYRISYGAAPRRTQGMRSADPFVFREIYVR